MRILVCNDDGYQAPGIVALATALGALGDVEVIAPELNNSAKSNALTLATPLSVRKAANGFRYINGTPADCVHIALTGLLDYRPDLVVSGINNGANMGDDTIYSGTVGAAMEGYLMGIPAIACSQVEKGWAHLDSAAQVVAQLVADLSKAHKIDGSPWLLNVNIPNRPAAELRPLKICRLGRRHSAEPVISQVNPMGETMYWIGSAGAVLDDSPGTDFHATFEGHVSVTPLQIDLTDYKQMDAWLALGARIGNAPL